MSTNIRYLKNGIPILMEKVTGSETVTFGIFVKTGASKENEKESGISHFVEHMMFKGTKTKTAKDISEIIDNVGGNINAYTGRNTTVYYIQMLPGKIDTGIDVLADMFKNSTFSQDNLDKERKVINEEIRMYEDIPEEIIHDENARMVIDGPQGNTVLGTIDSLKGITRDVFVHYFKEMYRPDNFIISVSGKIDPDKIYDKFNRNFGSIAKGKSLRKEVTTYNIEAGENIIKKKTNQVHICFNTRDVDLLDKRKYCVSVISNVLGGGMSSRLFQSIREDKGLAYSVYTYSTCCMTGGLFTVYAGTTKENYKYVMDMIKKEFAEIKKNGITQMELDRTKNQVASLLTFSLENSKNRMERMGNSYIIYNKIKNVKDVVKAIEKITLEDIKDTAAYMFDEKYYSSTVLGDI